ncbi:MAG: hypothetical protein MJH09_06180 [Cetobacterium sp.]|uniref:Uncharacterized protein n=1 Tax=Cetobacterium ceti TaxID=180163 RepID=A0A1T4MA85_9FUSO|nr:hypothetical protein [Cetobacterium ceti]MCJ8342421.1 hypothetical protein [Cetobacterium sp.]SJZ63757.1 hypothetical protein SAMN02745174_01121 [Cetobacterium ceti]
MELKQLIEKLEEKFKMEKNETVYELMTKLKELDVKLEQEHERGKVIEEIRDKNDEELIEWFRVKDI